MILVHRVEADRDACEDWLRAQGFSVSSFDGLEVLKTSPRLLEGAEVAAIHEDTIGHARDLEPLDGLGVVILGVNRPLELPAGAARLPIPFRLEELTSALIEFGHSDPEDDAPADPTSGEAKRLEDSQPISIQTMLLRGIAHTFNNPLAAASGWLQLLQLEGSSLSPSNRRIVDQLQCEIARMEKLAQALSIIGGKPGGLSVPFDPLDILEQARRRVMQQGLDMVLRRPDATPIEFFGDPTEIDLFFDLLLTSYLEDRSQVGTLEVTVLVQRNSLGITFEDEGALLEAGPRPADLGLLLQRTRHARAIALALGDALIRRRLGGEVQIIGSSLRPGARLEVTLPLAQNSNVSGESLAT